MQTLTVLWIPKCTDYSMFTTSMCTQEFEVDVFRKNTGSRNEVAKYETMTSMT